MMKGAGPTRYLWVYSAADEWTVAWHDRLLARRRAKGYDVEGFCNTPVALERRWLHFPELDRRWRSADPVLMNMYEELARKLDGRDVLILYNGANLHPEFLKCFDLLKVYTAGDDPESTEVLTRPIAPAFDIHLVNNIACLDMYRSWGLDKVHFWPLGSLSTLEDVSDLDESNILDVARRPIRVVFLGGYQQHRKDRLDRVAKAFPEAICAGSGWPRRFVPWDEMWALYRRSQIGWNFHNSTGPINFRTYELPAHGILQICDNRSNLGKIFDLDKEAVGFDSTEECIDRTRYYLEHPEEQRAIALAGWRRWKRDYHPDKVWEKLVEVVESHRMERRVTEDRPPSVRVLGSLEEHRTRCRVEQTRTPPKNPFRRALAAWGVRRERSRGNTAGQRDLAEKDHWDLVYERAAADITPGWTPRSYDALTLERILLETIDRYKPETVLEVGCGNSTWLPHLAKKRNVRVTGMDYSEKGCALARMRLAVEEIRGTIHCCDLFSADPGEIGKYDLVYSLGVVEHFSDLEGVLGRLLEFVRPGGALLTEVPNLVSIHGLLSWAYQPVQLAKHNALTRLRLERACMNIGLERIESAHAGLFSLDIVAWGFNQRWPGADRFVLPAVRKANRLSDKILRRLGTFRGLPPFSPFLYAVGTKRA